jgi:hypothetical protein
MHQDGFNSIQKGKYMNTLITCNQFKEMEEARRNRYNRFLSGCPNRKKSGLIPRGVDDVQGRVFNNMNQYERANVTLIRAIEKGR